MSETEEPRPDAQAGDRGARPLSRRASKMFVLVALLVVIFFALFTIYMIVRTADDPGIQQGIDEFRRDMGQSEQTSGSMRSNRQ